MAKSRRGPWPLPLGGPSSEADRPRTGGSGPTSDQLVGLVDLVCASLLPTGTTLGTLAKVYAADQIRFGVPAILLLLFAFLAGVAVYAELVVRSALVTLVVALAPLSFAAMVWPAARGAARKAVELVAAL